MRIPARCSARLLGRSLLSLLALAPLAPAGDLYVDPLAGDDANSGLLPSDPVATITRALALAGPGSLADPDRIHLAPGTYGPGETFPLVLRSYQRLLGGDADTTVIDAGAAPLAIRPAPTAGPGTFAERAIRIEGLTLAGAWRGVRWREAPAGQTLELRMDRCRIETGVRGLDLETEDQCAHRVELRGCAFHGCDMAIQHEVGAVHTPGLLLLEDCRFEGHGTGLVFYNSGPTTTNLVVLRRCEVRDTVYGVLAGSADDGQHLVVEDSLVEAHLRGLDCETETARIERCTITGADQFGGIGVQGGSGCCTSVSLFDSILYGNATDYAGDHLQASGNLVGTGSPDLLAASLQADPRFRDPASGDYRLAPDSPAIDHVPAVGTDLLGFDRTRADGDLDTVVLGDVGALEHRVLDGPATVVPGALLELELAPPRSDFAWVVTAPLADVATSTGFGDQWLDPLQPWTRVATVLAPATVPVPIPNDPALVGTELAFQALVRSPASPTGGAWSNPHTVRVE